MILLEGLRLVAAENPAVVFGASEAYLRSEVLSGLPLPAPLTTDCAKYHQIDAMANTLDCVFNASKSGNGGGGGSSATLSPAVVSGASALAKQLIGYSTPDAVLSSVLLSCVSALFPVIATDRDGMLMPAMNK